MERNRESDYQEEIIALRRSVADDYRDILKAAKSSDAKERTCAILSKAGLEQQLGVERGDTSLHKLIGTIGSKVTVGMARAMGVQDDEVEQSLEKGRVLAKKAYQLYKKTNETHLDAFIRTYGENEDLLL